MTAEVAEDMAAEVAEATTEATAEVTAEVAAALALAEDMAAGILSGFGRQTPEAPVPPSAQCPVPASRRIARTGILWENE